MRMLIAAALAITASAALADEVDEAHRLAVSGRDSYWNCLAREYQRESNKGMSGYDSFSELSLPRGPRTALLLAQSWSRQK